ncbi:MAG TPA: isochorismatase family protein [Caulobacteraceae bacterium]|nr:isochorismatase family protein [Caulobacteraceae bacterium]
MVRRVTRMMLSAAVALALAVAMAAPSAGRAQTIVDTWASVPLPPPPTLQPVAVDSAHTALLILDVAAVNCVPEKRPECVRSLPHIKQLLDAARAHKMLVVYSAGVATSTVPPDPAAILAPQPGEPMVRGPVDKFLGTDLDKILTDHAIKSVIVTGTSSEGAVLYTASGAALRGMTAIVPLDGASALTPFADLYTAWHLKNAPVAISSHVVLTRVDMIAMN